jgi:hypothetical protein
MPREAAFLADALALQVVELIEERLQLRVCAAGNRQRARADGDRGARVRGSTERRCRH